MEKKSIEILADINAAEKLHLELKVESARLNLEKSTLKYVACSKYRSRIDAQIRENESNIADVVEYKKKCRKLYDLQFRKEQVLKR